jgi:ribonucleoside-diphosphate reductase alpha chain
LTNRRDGKVVREVPAHEILREMAKSAWECADPGIQFHDTIQCWHMCPEDGEIRSSNPCSEYMFLDNSACNLASLNLVRFQADGGIDWPAFAQAVRVMLLAQDILVDYASYPTAAIAENSHRYRPLGLGYANLGGLLMRLALPYDSEGATRLTAKITGYMHALALETSADVAAAHGPFARWGQNKATALRVLGAHAEAWRGLGADDMPWVDELYAKVLAQAARTGLRNAQVTLIAPTGTIGLLMDCDTLGIEPDLALVKRKFLSGGGELILVNHAVGEALGRLGYATEEIERIVRFVREKGTVMGAPGFKSDHAEVFDCALAPAGHPDRRITPEGHLRLMAAAQPFLSGAISKTVNLPHAATVEDVFALFVRAWKLDLKSLAIYRDGSKTLQPLCAEC